MIPATVNLYDHYRGNTWDGMTIGPVLFNTGTVEEPVLVPPTNAVASCRMQFRNKEDDSLGYTFSSSPTAGEGSITIVDAVSWSFAVLPQLLILDAGKWLYDFECTDTAGAIMTLYKGVIKVIQDQTR